MFLVEKRIFKQIFTFEAVLLWKKIHRMLSRVSQIYIKYIVTSLTENFPRPTNSHKRKPPKGTVHRRRHAINIVDYCTSVWNDVIFFLKQPLLVILCLPLTLPPSERDVIYEQPKEKIIKNMTKNSTEKHIFIVKKNP
jgi:hypothetical protein